MAPVAAGGDYSALGAAMGAVLGLGFLIGLAFLLWVGLTPGQAGDNRFGPPPVQ